MKLLSLVKRMYKYKSSPQPSSHETSYGVVGVRNRASILSTRLLCMQAHQKIVILVIILLLGVVIKQVPLIAARPLKGLQVVQV